MNEILSAKPSVNARNPHPVEARISSPVSDAPYHVSLYPLGFSQIDGWGDDDHLAAFGAFQISAKRMIQRPYTVKALADAIERRAHSITSRKARPALALAEIAKKALGPDTPADGAAARRFFETHFEPYLIFSPEAKRANEHAVDIKNSFDGLVTAYFEPVIEDSPIKTERFQYPIYRRPDDLVGIDAANRPETMDSCFAFARKTGTGFTQYYDRKAIETGALEGKGLELFWLESKIDIFFIHIQGSARLNLPDGSVRRICYAAKTGHRFTPIGAHLVKTGALKKQSVSMQLIRQWLIDHPDEADAVMWRNRSFIFFQEVDHPEPTTGGPIAAASVMLSADRSLAIDHRLHTFGMPIFVATQKNLPGQNCPFRRLMIAQDTGSAIIGPSRGDIFMGSGEKSGLLAGAVKNAAKFIMLMPKPV